MLKNDKESKDCVCENKDEIEENDEISDAEKLKMCKENKTYALDS